MSDKVYNLDYKRYSEYYIVGGGIREINFYFDYGRYPKGYPYRLARQLRSNLARLLGEII